MSHQQRNSIALCAFALIPVTPVVAGDGAQDFEAQCEKIWSVATLYESESNLIIQKLSFTGRYHGDFYTADGDVVLPPGGAEQSESDAGYRLRRMRAGLKASIFENITLHYEGDFDHDENPWYDRTTDAYVGWKHSEALEMKLGKQGVAFTLEGATSSKELLTIDRSAVANNLWFTYEYAPGLSASGRIGNWVYSTGVFSQGEEDQEFGNFDAGAFYLASAGYDFASMLDSDLALLRLDYVMNEETSTPPELFSNRDLSMIASLNFRYSEHNHGIMTDLVYADGYDGQSDLWGFVIMPHYSFTPCLQGVLRYSFVDSDGSNGVRIGGYESLLSLGEKGDRYQEIYAGLNYYIYGHKLKVQTGVAYSDMEDSAADGGSLHGLSWITGLRISW
jgi:phosphate-selective porin OprO/OprP